MEFVHRYHPSDGKIYEPLFQHSVVELRSIIYSQLSKGNHQKEPVKENEGEIHSEDIEKKGEK